MEIDLWTIIELQAGVMAVAHREHKKLISELEDVINESRESDVSERLEDIVRRYREIHH